MGWGKHQRKHSSTLVKKKLHRYHFELQDYFSCWQQSTEVNDSSLSKKERNCKWTQNTPVQSRSSFTAISVGTETELINS